jgi:glycosyltransferase involved in cell wall biosynthesis
MSTETESLTVSSDGPRFSLIVATLNRSDELLILLSSLANQVMRDFELIVVDQNADDQLAQVLDEWASQTNDKQREMKVSVKHLRCSPGVSQARNLGILYSRGEILAFPDDDSWYQADTLETVDAWFKSHDEYGILSVGCRDERGRVSTNSWWQTECDINWINMFRTTATCCYFIRRRAELATARFDETLGPGAGTIYGCGEDTDFIITLMKQGIRGRFCSHIYVGHPRRDGFVDAVRARRYGGGFGRVLAKHSYRILFLGFVAYDFARAAVHRLVGNRARSSQLWAHGKGIISAYYSR